MPDAAVLAPAPPASALHHLPAQSARRGSFASGARRLFPRTWRALWVDHLGSALQHSTGARRLFVSFDDLVERPDAELARIAAFVGPNAAPPLAGESAGTPLTDATLRHHHTQLTAVLNDDSLAFPAKALYLALLLHRDGIDAQREDDYGSAVDRLAASARLSQAETLGQHAANERQSQQLVDVHGGGADRRRASRVDAPCRRGAGSERDEALIVIATLRTEIDLLKGGLEESRAAARGSATTSRGCRTSRSGQAKRSTTRRRRSAR